MDEGREILLRRDAADVEEDVVPVQAPLRPDALTRVSGVEPLGVHTRGDDVRDFRGRGEGEDFLEDCAARDDDALGLRRNTRRENRRPRSRRWRVSPNGE